MAPFFNIMIRLYDRRRSFSTRSFPGRPEVCLHVSARSAMRFDPWHCRVIWSELDARRSDGRVCSCKGPQPRLSLQGRSRGSGEIAHWQRAVAPRCRRSRPSPVQEPRADSRIHIPADWARLACRGGAGPLRAFGKSEEVGSMSYLAHDLVARSPTVNRADRIGQTAQSPLKRRSCALRCPSMRPWRPPPCWALPAAQCVGANSDVGQVASRQKAKFD